MLLGGVGFRVHSCSVAESQSLGRVAMRYRDLSSRTSTMPFPASESNGIEFYLEADVVFLMSLLLLGFCRVLKSLLSR